MDDESKLRAEVQRLCEASGEDIRAQTKKILDDWEARNRGMARSGWTLLILLLIGFGVLILFNLLLRLGMRF